MGFQNNDDDDDDFFWRPQPETDKDWWILNRNLSRVREETTENDSGDSTPSESRVQRDPYQQFRDRLDEELGRTGTNADQANQDPQ